MLHVIIFDYIWFMTIIMVFYNSNEKFIYCKVCVCVCVCVCVNIMYFATFLPNVKVW